MNIKINQEKGTFIAMCIHLNIPKKIIGKILEVNEATIKKHAKKAITDTKESAPTSTYNELRLELFKLYAYTISDPTDVQLSFGVGGDEFKKMQHALFKYLHLERFVSFCEGITAQMAHCQKTTFADGILEHEIKLIEAVIGTYENPYAKGASTGKNLFTECLKLMHAKHEFMPVADDINKPARVLSKATENILSPYRYEIGLYIPRVTVDYFLKVMRETLSEKQKSAMLYCFDFPEKSPSLIQHISQKRIEYWCYRGVKQLQNTSRLYFKKEPFAFLPEFQEVLPRIHQIYAEYQQEVAKKRDDLMAIEKIRTVGLILTNFINLNKSHESLTPEIISAMITIKPSLEKVLQRKGVAVDGFPNLEMDERPMNPELLELLCSHIDDLDLSVRAYNCLHASKLRYMWQIVNHDLNDLLGYRNLGKKSLLEIEILVMEKGLKFKTHFSPETEKYLREKTVLLKK